MRTEALLAVLPALAASSPHWIVVTLAPAPLNVMYGLVSGSVTFSLKLHNSTFNNIFKSYSLLVLGRNKINVEICIRYTLGS